MMVGRVDAASELADVTVDDGDVGREVAAQRPAEVRGDVRVVAVHTGVHDPDRDPLVAALDGVGTLRGRTDHLHVPLERTERVLAGNPRPPLTATFGRTLALGHLVLQPLDVLGLRLLRAGRRADGPVLGRTGQSRIGSNATGKAVRRTDLGRAHCAPRRRHSPVHERRPP